MPSITKAWTWARDTCNRANVGYSQTYRNQQTVGGITYYDCSSFINFALLAGGFTTPSYAPSHNSFTTWTEPAELMRLGFKKVTDGTLKVGDIGVSNTSSMQHTEMVYAVSGNLGQWMGAHTDSYALADQVSITSAWVGNWFTDLYRYEGEDEGTEPVEPTYTLTVTYGTASKTTGKKGDTATLTATKYKGWKFTGWEIKSGAGRLTNDKSETNCTFTFTSGNCTVEAQYRQIKNMSIVMYAPYPFIKNIDNV